LQILIRKSGLPGLYRVALIGLALVGFTWYMEIVTDIRYSLVITIMFSLTAIKAIVFIVDYRKFYNWVAGILKKDEGKKIVLVDVAAGVFGLVMIAFSIWLL
jgi:hypothetical protein